MRGTVAVLIPALDEEAALPGVLRDLARMGPDLVVVADNGSTDRTPAVAREWGAMVVREAERGYGAACLAGLRFLAALPDPPDVVVFLDADGSHDPGDLPRLAEPIASGGADLVLGVRRSTGRPGAVPVHARLGNRLVLTLARALFGCRFQDLPPFRAVRFDALWELGMDDRNWGWTLQMQIRASMRGLRVLEVPVTHRDRTAGRSKISGSLAGSVRAGAKMLYTLYRERRLLSGRASRLR